MHAWCGARAYSSQGTAPLAHNVCGGTWSSPDRHSRHSKSRRLTVGRSTLPVRACSSTWPWFLHQPVPSRGSFLRAKPSAGVSHMRHTAATPPQPHNGWTRTPRVNSFKQVRLRLRELVAFIDSNTARVGWRASTAGESEGIRREERRRRRHLRHLWVVDAIPECGHEEAGEHDRERCYPLRHAAAHSGSFRGAYAAYWLDELHHLLKRAE